MIYMIFLITVIFLHTDFLFFYHKVTQRVSQSIKKEKNPANLNNLMKIIVQIKK